VIEVSSSDSISYERLADRYDQQRGGLARGAGFAADLAAWVRSYPILEVGVGTGAIAKPLGDLCKTAIMGADLSPTMAARAQERLGPRVMVADAQHLPAGTSRLGTVVLVWVLQLVGSATETLEEAVRVLRPGGRVLALLAMQTNRRAEDMQGLLVDWWAALGRPRPDTVQRVREAAKAAGLVRVKETRTTEQEWQQSPKEAAQMVEERAFGPLFDLDHATFGRVAQPIANRLRQLPDPDRPRVCAARHPLLIFEKRRH
jgi:ubiquinone/menaquinone biosynthesis C-methylase UbiE